MIFINSDFDREDAEFEVRQMQGAFMLIGTGEEGSKSRKKENEFGFTEEQETNLKLHVDGNQMPNEEEMSEILGISEDQLLDAMVFLEYEQCQDCGCWEDNSNGDFIDNDFVCYDCEDLESRE